MEFSIDFDGMIENILNLIIVALLEFCHRTFLF